MNPAMKELENLVWYKIPEMGWRIMHVSARFSDRWYVTMLGAGLVGQVHSQLLSPVDPATIRHFHSERRGQIQFECYIISPAVRLQGAPFHWYVDLNAQFAGGSASTEAEAKQKVLDFIEEKSRGRE
jgi:hypothetical protein